MNKAMIFPIHKKWVDMIFNGEKDFEFRNKLPKDLKPGMKIYFYECKGKRKKGYCVPKKYKDSWGCPCSDCIAYVDGEPPFDGCSRNLKLTSNPPYEGTGKIVGEAMVSNMYKIGIADRPFYDKTKLRSWSKFEVLEEKFRKIMGWEKEGFFTWMPTEVEPLQKQGYTTQKYAIELDNIIKYDEEWQLRDKAYKPEKWVSNYKFNAPTEPIDKSEFVKWCPRMIDGGNGVECGSFATYDCQYQDIDRNPDNSINVVSCDNKHVTHAPQAPIYVVEKNMIQEGETNGNY